MEFVEKEEAKKKWDEEKNERAGKKKETQREKTKVSKTSIR